MWHPEILNQQLDKIVKQVIICQKIIRGFLCRKRLINLLELVQKQTHQKREFIHYINKHGSLAFQKMNGLNESIRVSCNNIVNFFFKLNDFLKLRRIFSLMT